MEKKYKNIKQDKLRDKVVNKIIKRQEKTLEKYTGLKEIIEGIKNPDSLLSLKGQAYESLRYIVQNNPEPVAHIYNAGEMPFGVSSDASRSPYTTEEELHNYLGLEYDPELDHANTGINIFRDFNNTPDIQKTHPDIQALADELGGNARNIYRWVYNNIYYIPSFGSIQGDVQTLHNRQGNAFDIASLLISLLRASNIPARYVYGTVLLPADQVNNWVGGVDDIQSARVIMAQGGIPGSAVSYGGRFEKLRFEHVWVEAWGNFGQTGSFQWNPMDAAFKQYSYTGGVDLLGEVGFDSEQFQEVLGNSSVVNETQGWIANVESSQMQSQLSQYQEAIQNYLTDIPENTPLAQVLGGQEIIQYSDDGITNLPYEEFVRTRSFSELPENLRHYFRFNLATQPDWIAGGISGGSGTSLMLFQESLPQLAGKEIAISFRPATPGDQAVVNSLFGNIANFEDIPTEIDAGSFEVIGELSLDGEVVASTATPIDFGAVLVAHKGFVDPRFGYRNTTSPMVAGDYQAVGIDLQGVTIRQLEKMQESLDWVRNNLESRTLENLTKHDAVGRVVQAGMLAYFAINDTMTSLASRISGLVHYRMPSFGTFSTYSQVTSFWGSPNRVQLGGMVMDVDWLMANNEGRVNCWQDWVAFNQIIGQMSSAYEHIVPEQLLSTSQQEVEFVSTVKAFRLANAEGQRIYFINQDNIDQILPLIEVDNLLKADIQTAVAAGNEAIVHQRPVVYGDYIGSGYILLDPETGTGAYKISGGGNGSVHGFAFGLGLIMSAIALLAISGGALTIILAILPMLFASIMAHRMLGSASQCYWAGFFGGFMAASLLFMPIRALIARLGGTAAGSMWSNQALLEWLIGATGIPGFLFNFEGDAFDCVKSRGLGG